MKDFSACLSRKSDDWRTPSNIYNLLLIYIHKDIVNYRNPSCDLITFESLLGIISRD